MNSLIFNMIMTLILLQSVSLTTTQTSGSEATFSAKIFSAISEENMNENVIISPASIQTALALTYVGAEGNTANELRQGLNLGSNDVTKEQVRQQFGNLMSKMRSSGKATFRMANRIYVKDGLQIAPIFNDVAQRYFASDAENVNFADNVKAAKNINNWVEKQTENNIHDLISPDDLDANTAAVLVNAIYFKGTWIRTFSEYETSKKYFHLNAKSSKVVRMMYQTDYFDYANLTDLDATALSMGYSDTKVRMLVLLPNQLNGLGQLEQQLKEVDLTKLLKKLGGNYGEVYFPKFKMEFDVSLQSTLEKLGMHDLFNKTAADFSSLLNSEEQLYVSDVVHKAFIQVNETGTEATGATGILLPILLNGKLDRVPAFMFNVDHPFYFALLDDDTVYFTGHVVDIIDI